MKTIALLLGVMVMCVGVTPLWALHHVMEDKLFYVTVMEGGLFFGDKVDEGLVWLEWDEEREEHVFHSFWFGNGWYGPYDDGDWEQKDNVNVLGDYDPRWCSWEAWYEFGHPAPYDDFTGWYHKQADVVIGIIERLNQQEDLQFYGENLRTTSRGAPEHCSQWTAPGPDRLKRHCYRSRKLRSGPRRRHSR